MAFSVYTLLKKRIISSGEYDRDDIQKKMDVYLAYNRLTEEQYTELIGMMNKTV